MRKRRYADASAYVAEERDGSAAPRIGRRYTSWRSTGSRFYEVREGETLFNIAASQLGDDGLWWRIMDLNFDILSVWDVEPGRVIRLPIMDDLR
jgi:hypothetical protein